MKQTLLEIEQNIKSRKETDKIMWFSMWAVLTIASFGVAWFPMIYYLIKRRNAHFARQQKLEELILSKIKPVNPDTANSELPKHKNPLFPRNATALTVATILIVPAFYVFHILLKDLKKHEEDEHDFLSEIIALTKDSEVKLNIQGFVTSPNISTKKFVGLSVVTCGLAAAYWLYLIFNIYNSHFKMQWSIEGELLHYLKETDEKAN